MSFEPIAIIGRSCVLPGALSPEALWEAVFQGRDLVTGVDSERWRLSAKNALGTIEDSKDRAWSDRGGYVDGFESIFDPTGFALPAEEILKLDPLFQWILHTSREALREGGVQDTSRAGAIIGNLSFPSSGLSSYAERSWLGEDLANTAGVPQTAPENRFMSGLPAHLLAEALELGDLAFALDAACASSLYAIKLACDRLHDRSADLMLAGAVNRADDLFLHIGFCALKALSPSGQSRPFHKDADGLVPANGAGMVLLKRLGDAQRDGDPILGVIRAVALSNDGRGKGFLAPSKEGQIRAMRSAYELAGLDPGDISLLECHATGTTVGDKTEIESMSAVFEGSEDLPVGSLKSNMGHLITAAGVAGLIKVIEAMKAGVRPASLHASEKNEALENTPIRVIDQNEAWLCDGPRRAGVSAFGFGGNNAHLIVEEYSEKTAPTVQASQTLPRSPVAIVGMGVVAGDSHGCEAFSTKLFAEKPSSPLPCDEARINLSGLRFPPADLKSALPQQLLLMEAANEALQEVKESDRNRSGVFIGMGCDAEVARYGARWRMADWAESWGIKEKQWLQSARDAFIPLLEAPGVLGTMPNIPANRLNSQLDLGGSGYTISSEELSGIRALEVGARALRSKELDMAIVGAVDLSCEPVHEAARKALGEDEVAGDAAVVLVLKRLDDATSAGDHIIALLDDDAKDVSPMESAGEVLERFGHAHAAKGLLQVAAASLCCSKRRKIGGKKLNNPSGLSLKIEGMSGQSATIKLNPGMPWPTTKTNEKAKTQSLAFPAHLPQIEVPQMPSINPENKGVGLRPEEPIAGHIYTMAPAPRLAPILDIADIAAIEPEAPAEISELPQPEGIVPPMQATMAPVTPPASADLPESISDFYARIQIHQKQITQVHQDFLAQQTAVQEQFLKMRQRALDNFVDVYRGVTQDQGLNIYPQSPAPAPAETLNLNPAPVTPEPKAPAAPPVQSTSPSIAKKVEPPTPALKPIVPEPIVPQPIVPEPIPKAAEAKTPGPKTLLSQAVRGTDFQLNRSQLEIDASGKISEIFGPLFEQQDGYERQVRMPEPPLLLADRVIGLDAEAGSMGLGSIWTETDVEEDSWYLHDGRMPAGVMIEAGQADLMLISYLGIDFINKSERTYRLLGCELTYHGNLPKAGETLRYDIHVDGHAAQGDIRLFFFHYDCQVNGRPQLTVREGQAGFFSDEELAESDGVIWSAETGERTENPRLDSAALQCQSAPFSRKQLSAFAEGDVTACFGPGYEATYTHTRTPRIAGGRMLFLDEVTHLDTQGGPWGRGYLRAMDTIAPDDWFFDGHFKNDPCMPGTLMFEGCMQAMAFYLTSMGYTTDKDGWRFEPVPEEPYQLRCRGQVTPTSKELIYEIFVDEVIDGPYPTLYADLLCTVDGLKAFHCRRMGLRLVPGWPLDSRPDLLKGYVEAKPVASAKGFQFDYASLLACAWGQPSHAFGPMYELFDDTRRVARLPGPPYHFMTRVSHIDGEIGNVQAGAVIEIEYDIPPKAWYFRENGCASMPFCVLLEAALQPCGWLASFVGSATTVEHDMFFRNLDGTGNLKRELLPDSGTLKTRVKITNISQSAGMIIESFDVECFVGEESVYDMKTVFGFFPKEALANQVGLAISEEQRTHLEGPSEFFVGLTERPEAYCSGDIVLPEPYLLMLDRVTGYWPDGGKKGLGLFRGEKDVDQSEWFFKAHFHQDPVQPGSLGIEAMIQLLQFAMLEKGMAKGIEAPRFEPIALDAPMSWKYRGQVRLHNKVISSTIEIVEEGSDERGAYAIADAALWVDGMRIYEASNLGMRIVSGTIDVPAKLEVLNPEEDLWVKDHCPTWTVPALPLMSMVDRIAESGSQEGRVVVGLKNVKVNRWLALEGDTEIHNKIEGAGHEIDVALSNSEGDIASGKVLLGMNWTSGPAPWKELDAAESPNPYETGALFHGPAFQILKSLRMGSSGSSAVLDAGGGKVPLGTLNQLLLDGATHAIPHDNLSQWCADIPDDHVAYPIMITEMSIHGPTPDQGDIRCEVRFDGFFGGARFPAFKVQLIRNQQVWCAFRLVEALFPKGPIGRAKPGDRRSFLRDRKFVDGVGLSSTQGNQTKLQISDIEASDWLSGTVAGIYGSTDPQEIAKKDHLAAQTGLHPGAIPEGIPLNQFELTTQSKKKEIVVTQKGEGKLDLTQVQDFWASWFGLDNTPVHDLFYGMIERFVRRVIIEDPTAMDAIKDRNVLYLANHQVAVESLLFSVLSGALAGRPTMTLAKAEHRTTWVGKLIAHSFNYPSMKDPEVIYFFDRNNRAELVEILQTLAGRMATEERSMLVHIEGTRSLSCSKPVEKMASIFIDMAIASNLPIVPVRFTGGIPSEDLPKRLEFPVGMGSQDYWLGRPILPEELATLGAKERKARVIEGINSLAMDNAQESAHSPDPEFSARVEQRLAEKDVPGPQAVLLRTLEEKKNISPETKEILDAIRSGTKLKTRDAGKKAWMTELIRRLEGEGVLDDLDME